MGLLNDEKLVEMSNYITKKKKKREVIGKGFLFSVNSAGYTKDCP